MLRLQLFLVFSLAALSGRAAEPAATPPTAQVRAADEAAIRAHVAAYEAALNRGDAAAIANLYTTGGDLIVNDGSRIVGREAVQRAAAAEFSARAATWRISLATNSIRFLGPDIAIVETEATFNEGELRADRGTSVMVREGGKWMLAALRVYMAQRP